MDKDEIIEFLKDKLCIAVEQSSGNYGEKYCCIKLILDNEVIDEDSIDLD